jgi:8-oxo-dGTP pyrophosphatase MutT (NUDIX family)
LPEKRVVTCFLECGDKILLLRRSGLVGSFQGRWAGVSGYIETTAGEQALVEIEEETGLRRGDVELVKRGSPLKVEGEGVRWVVYPFLFQIKDRSKIRIDWEHSEQRWIAPDEIDDYQTVPMLKEVLARVYKNIGESKGGEASLKNTIPPPFIREGDTGGGLVN